MQVIGQRGLVLSGNGASPAGRTVALVCIRLDPRDARLAKQARALRAAGWQVDLVTWEGEDGPYPSLPGATLVPWRGSLAGQMSRLPLPGTARSKARAVARRQAMVRQLATGNYAAVVVSDPETLQPAATAKAAGGYGLVYDAHEYYPEEVPDDPARMAWVMRAHQAAASALDGFITVNPDIADLYRQTSPWFPPAQVVRNASDLPGPPGDDGRLADAIGWRGPILLFQGALTHQRGLPALVQAMEQAPPDWRLAVLGGGPLEASLRAVAGERVRFLAPVPWDSLHLWTAGAALGAVLYEGTCANQRLCSPNKLWEYPAAGVPLLATDLPFLGAAVRAAGIGLVLSEPVAPSAIAGALAQATAPRLASWRGACEAFTKAWPWQREADRFVDVVTQAARRA